MYAEKDAHNVFLKLEDDPYPDLTSIYIESKNALSQSTKDELIDENLFNVLKSDKEIISKETSSETEIREAFNLLPVYPWFDASISYSKISPIRAFTGKCFWQYIGQFYYKEISKENWKSLNEELKKNSDIICRIPKLEKQILYDVPKESEKILDESFHSETPSFTKSKSNKNNNESQSLSIENKNSKIVDKNYYDMEDDLFVLKMREISMKVLEKKENNESFNLNSSIVPLEEICEELSIECEKKNKELKASLLSLAKSIQEERESEIEKGLCRMKVHDSIIRSQSEFEYINYLETLENMNIKEGDSERITKAIQRNMTKIQNSVIDDTVCQICNDGEFSDFNQIVFCAGCNVTVHQKCYGIPVLPESEWICEVCWEYREKGKFMRCGLCTVVGGAMKKSRTNRTSSFASIGNFDYEKYLEKCRRKHSNRISKESYGNGVNNSEDGIIEPYMDFQISNQRIPNIYSSKFDGSQEPIIDKVWVHSLCAISIPEIPILSNSLMTPGSFEHIDNKRFALTCVICNQRKQGACIQCNRGKCQVAFHAECARRADYFMDIIPQRRGDSLIFCEKHTPLKLQKSFEVKSKKSREEILKFSRWMTRAFEVFSKSQVKKVIGTKRVWKSPKEESIHFINSLKAFLKKTPEYIFSWTLQRDPEFPALFKINEIKFPKKFYLRSNIGKSDKIWYSFKYGTLNPAQLYKKYRKLMLELKERRQKANANSRHRAAYEQPVYLDNTLYCVCKQVCTGNDLMIECSVCQNWFHFDCVGILADPDELINIDYHCDECKSALPKNILRDIIEKTRDIYTSEKLQFIETLYLSRDDEDFKCAVSYLGESSQNEEDVEIMRIKLRKLN